MNGYPARILHNTSNVAADNSLPVNIAHFAQTHTDAFGRLRVSNAFTLFDSFHRFQDNGKIGEYTAGTANSMHDALSGSIRMGVGSNVGDVIYRESTRVFAYQPGKSLIILQTFCMNPGKVGLRQRQGYFDAANGTYIQLNANQLSFVRRSSVSGTVKETIVNQNDWNIDKMDGSGPSHFVIDITRTQLLFIDIEWLGAGCVRMGFVLEGKFCLCHMFHHANQPSTPESDTTLPYMTTACLPVRAELENIAATGSPSYYRLICASVMSEGGYDLRGRSRSIGTEFIDVPKNLPIKNTFYQIVSIRLKSTRLGAIVIPTQFHLIGTVASDYKWRIIVDATISGGGAWISAGTDSCVEYKLDGTDPVTTGSVLKSGFFTATINSSPVVVLDSSKFHFQLERNSFTGNAFTFTIAVASKAPNDKVLGSLDWEEIT
jgi:hypothetical protein